MNEEAMTRVGSQRHRKKLHEDLYTLITLSGPFLLGMECAVDNSYRENKTHILCLKFFSEYRDVYEVMWKTFLEPSRPQVIICRNTSQAL
jgi:hypothetical protein